MDGHPLVLSRHPLVPCQPWSPLPATEPRQQRSVSSTLCLDDLARRGDGRGGMMERRLAGKVALVTGSDSGIGRGIAELYAEHGVDVTVTYHTDRAGADETA